MNSHSISLSQKKTFVPTFSPETGHVAVVALVAIAVMVPMAFWGMPSANDLSNHFRFALPFYDALSSGHLYPGWLAESNGGFGDPSFRFYPPALYYLLALGRFTTGNWFAASMLTFTVLSLLAAIGMYLWAREFTSSQTAMWAGIFYSVAPYHLNQFFQALMLAEFAAAAVLPFTFLFVERVCKYRRPKDVAGLAAAYGLLVLTNLPLAVIGSIALALYALLRIEKSKVARTISALGISAGLGLAASACYWTTMIFELKWIHGNDLNPEPGISYSNNFVLSTFSPDSLGVWWMNILLLSSAAMFWPAAVLASRTARQYNLKIQGKALIALVAILAMTLFMATPLSRPVWDSVHLLQETQFPWRWFSISSIAASLLLALSVPFWTQVMKTRKRPLVMFAIGTVAISFAFSFAHIIREARWLTPAQFEQTLSDIRGSASIPFWLPIWAHAPLPEMNALVEAGDRNIKIESWTPEKRVFHIDRGNATVARVKTFFYPLWAATAAGRVLPTSPDEHGALLIAVPPEGVSVQLDLREPRRGRLAGGATLAGWFLIGLLLIPIYRRTGK